MNLFDQKYVFERPFDELIRGISEIDIIELEVLIAKKVFVGKI